MRIDENHSQRINVAHITYGMRTGGMERLLVEFAKHANKDKFRLHFYSLTTAEGVSSELVQAGARVHAFSKRPGFSPRLVRDISRKLKQDGVRIVHTHNSGAMVYGTLSSLMSRIPCVVHTRHGQRLGATKRQNRVFSALSRLTNRVISVSGDSHSLTLSEGVPPRRATMIQNGIDLRTFRFHGRRTTGPALTVARLSPEKGLDTLIEAVPKIRRINPFFELVIAGDGPCRAALEAQIKELGLEGVVRLLGERRDIPQLMSRSSLFILPSRSEGISLTLLEAMATGLPVVATDVGGTPEVVQAGRAGLLVPPNDSSGLANAVVSLCLDPARANRISTAARQRVEEYFDVRQMVQRYEQTYVDVLAESNKSPQPSGARPPMPLPALKPAQDAIC